MTPRGAWPGPGRAVPLDFDSNEVERTILGKINKTETCWLWQGPRQERGYGHLRARIGGVSVKVLAHRAAYTVWRGPIPSGLTIDHLCENKQCVNPDHLEAVSHRENIRRGPSLVALNAVKTHCKHGHPLDGRNLILVRRGRECRTCRDRLDAERRQLIREAADALGVSRREYIALYGEGPRAARHVLAARTAVGR